MIFTKINNYLIKQESTKKFNLGIFYFVFSLLFLLVTVGLAIYFLEKLSFYDKLVNKEINLKNKYQISRDIYIKNLNLFKKMKLEQEQSHQLINQIPSEIKIGHVMELFLRESKLLKIKMPLFSPQKEKKLNDLIILPIHLTLLGNYNQFRLFLLKISYLNIPISFEQIEISLSENKETLKMHLIINIHRMTGS